MSEPLAEQIIRKITEATGMYHRLILVVASSGGGKTAALSVVAKQVGYPYINVNLELSRRLLELTERQRSLQLPRLLDDVVKAGDGPVALLDNIEILFAPSLKQDPLRCLQGLARNTTVVAAWNGKLENGHVIYAEPGHQEYYRCPKGDLLIAS